MKMLLVKTSSMGDIIHTLPALSDAKRAIPSLQVDWVVEEHFQAIPRWHESVRHIIPVALRRWRKHPFALNTLREWHHFYRALRNTRYDIVLDAQGLLKSAVLSSFAKTHRRVGLHANAARESHAAWFYQEKIMVAKKQHAIQKLRELFSKTLQYDLPDEPPHYGIQLDTPERTQNTSAPYIVLLHGTTWESKAWPEEYWCALTRLITHAGFHIKISGGNDTEIARATRIAATTKHIDLHPLLSIEQMAAILSEAKGVIAVDTGFAHLAAALDKPLVTLYGATSATLTGALGKHAKNLIATSPACTPCLKRTCSYTGKSTVTPACYEALTPERAWTMLSEMMSFTT